MSQVDEQKGGALPNLHIKYRLNNGMSSARGFFNFTAIRAGTGSPFVPTVNNLL